MLTVLSDTLYIQTKWHHNFLSYLLQLKLIFKAEFSARVHPLWRRFEYKKFGYRLWLLPPPHAQTLFIKIVRTFRACSTPPHSTEICADKRGVDLEMPTHLKTATIQQQTNQMGFDWLWPRKSFTTELLARWDKFAITKYPLLPLKAELWPAIEPWWLSQCWWWLWLFWFFLFCL